MVKGGVWWSCAAQQDASVYVHVCVRVCMKVRSWKAKGQIVLSGTLGLFGSKVLPSQSRDKLSFTHQETPSVIVGNDQAGFIN